MGLTAAAIGVAVAGTAYSVDQTKKAARRQERAQQIQQNQQISEQRQANVQAERKRRITASRLLQSAENTGTGTSSGVFNAISAGNTNQAQGMAFGGQRVMTAQSVGRNLGEAREAGVNASIGQGVAQLGMTVFSSQGGFSNMFSSGGGG
jgi:Flp pilus assembly protein TadB